MLTKVVFVGMDGVESAVDVVECRADSRALPSARDHNDNGVEMPFRRVGGPYRA